MKPRERVFLYAIQLAAIATLIFGLMFEHAAKWDKVALR